MALSRATNIKIQVSQNWVFSGFPSNTKCRVVAVIPVMLFVLVLQDKVRKDIFLFVYEKFSI